MKTAQGRIARTIVARLERGEDLYASLTKLVREGDIRNGCFQVMGALGRGKVGIFEGGEYEWVSHEGPLEISSCVGNIAVKEGEPFVHCHAVLNDHRGTILGGHVGEGCIADPTAEVHVQVYEGEVTRRFDEESNLWLLDI
jgi:predicted DNA-binding protein with PD1-like motif